MLFYMNNNLATLSSSGIRADEQHEIPAKIKL